MCLSLVCVLLHNSYPAMRIRFVTVPVSYTHLNLERKGYVTPKRVGNTYQYTPAIRENEYKRHFMSGEMCIRDRDYRCNFVAQNR